MMNSIYAKIDKFQCKIWALVLELAWCEDKWIWNISKIQFDYFLEIFILKRLYDNLLKLKNTNQT
jgi:hypothetical protein